MRSHHFFTFFDEDEFYCIVGFQLECYKLLAKGKPTIYFFETWKFHLFIFMSMHGTGHYEDAADDAAPLLMPAELYRRHSVRQLQLQVAGGKIKLKR